MNKKYYIDLIIVNIIICIILNVIGIIWFDFKIINIISCTIGWAIGFNFSIICQKYCWLGFHEYTFLADYTTEVIKDENNKSYKEIYECIKCKKLKYKGKIK